MASIIIWMIALIALIVSLFRARTYRARRVHAIISLCLCFIVTTGLPFSFAGVGYFSAAIRLDSIVRDVGVLSGLLFLGLGYYSNDKWTTAEGALLAAAWVSTVLPMFSSASLPIWLLASLAALALPFAPAPQPPITTE